MLRIALTVSALALAGGAATSRQTLQGELALPAPAASHGRDTVSAAADDLEIGRFWHERERLLAIGLAGALLPQDRLRLAVAEAGWENWSAVIEILENAEWRDRLGDGRGAFLLARAYEETGSAARAQEAYLRFLTVAPLGSPDALTARIRRARLLAADGRLDDAMAEIAQLESAPAGLGSWVALELASAEARAGNVESVNRLFKLIVAPGAEAEKWELVPRAYLNAKARPRALQAYESILSRMDDTSDRARVWATIGELRREAGDVAGAREAFLNALDTGSEGEAVVRASTGLTGMGVDDPGLALRMAQALEGAQRTDDALQAYTLYSELAGADVRASAELARALLLAGKRQNQAASTLLETLVRLDDEGIAPRAIESLIAVRRRQGQNTAVEPLEADLLLRFPHSAEAASVLFFRADAHHDNGQIGEAASLYARAAAAAPATMRGGLSSMRLGQIHITRGEFTQAAEVFEAYARAAPLGTYSDEAAYWAARSWLEVGESQKAQGLLGQLQRISPVSYYAVQTADLTGRPYEIPMAPAAPVPVPPWLASGLELMRITQASGLRRAETDLAARLVERARPNDVALLQVARGFHELERNLEAIQLGWEVQRRGYGWDRLLLEVIYPFPFREMVVEEAKEVGVDPFLMAALIRQESAFQPRARSVANARGLMQVMPATGQELARKIGPRGLQTATLYVPDINLHLGAAYLTDMMGRYGGRLPLVLSAYNAGPHRATRWERFPEVEDPVRFTERIPFRETRGYVKNVTRNYHVYRFLYSE